MNCCTEPRALFRSVKSALAFAYYATEFSVQATAHPGRADQVGPALSMQEKQAQAALIRRTVERRLQGVHLAVMFADYGVGDVRSAAVREVCWEAGKVLRNRSLGVALAKRLFAGGADKLSHAQLAKQFAIPSAALPKLNVLVSCEVARWRQHTDAELIAALVSTGIASAL